MALSTQNRVRITVSHADLPPIDWDRISGGDRTHNSTKVRPAAGKKKVVLVGDSEVDPIVVEAFIDPVAHATVLQALHAGQKFEGTTITRQFIDSAEVPVGTAMTYFGCAVSKFTPPDADANGEDGAKLIVEWTVGD